MGEAREAAGSGGVGLEHGVIWITGYSAAGKTTVARSVIRRLRAAGVPAVHLDGDDLRSILAHRWGYERDDRVELARVYFRLCSHLAAQGLTVVISAIAMYDEVREWVSANIPNAMEVYLDVPEEERRRRDAATKKIYASGKVTADLYDEPKAPALRIANMGEVTPELAAERIVRHYMEHQGQSAVDAGRTDHWRAYYRSAQAPLKPSPFAETVAGRLPPAPARLGHDVTAVDPSDAAIEFCRERHADTPARFEVGALPQVAPRLVPGFDVAYSRFVLHAMPLEEEIQTLAAAARLLKPGGRLYVECRSINDPMARLGEVISPTERIHGHYRRFIIAEELKERVRDAGFEVLDMIESNGLAVFGDDDPVVIRLTAERR